MLSHRHSKAAELVLDRMKPLGDTGNSPGRFQSRHSSPSRITAFPHRPRRIGADRVEEEAERGSVMVNWPAPRPEQV
jgi:hypothetical protein